MSRCPYRLFIGAAIVVLMVVGAGCGGGGAGATSGHPADSTAHTPVATWIPAMCAAEAAWFDAGDQQGKDLLAKLYTVSTAKEWKRLMADYAAASVLRTNQLEADLKRAGVPDVDRGEEIASRFRHSAALLKAVYRAYGADIAALDERHPEVMQQSAQTIGGRVKTSETSILNDAVAALNLDPSVSDRAADNADCQSAFSFTGG